MVEAWLGELWEHLKSGKCGRAWERPYQVKGIGPIFQCPAGFSKRTIKEVYEVVISTIFAEIRRHPYLRKRIKKNPDHGYLWAILSTMIYFVVRGAQWEDIFRERCGIPPEYVGSLADWEKGKGKKKGGKRCKK